MTEEILQLKLKRKEIKIEYLDSYANLKIIKSIIIIRKTQANVNE